MFKDARFQSGQGKYDKYGRRIEKTTNELKKFYRLEDDDGDDKQDGKEDDNDDNDDDEDELTKGSARASSSSDDDEPADEPAVKTDEKLSRLEYLNRMARGELADGSSSDSDSNSDSDDADDADEALASEPESEKEDVPLGDETTRFAVQNCDWSRIRAVDILALCQSFAPATGAVHDVTIYPSDFGLQKMVRCGCVGLDESVCVGVGADGDTVCV